MRTGFQRYFFLILFIVLMALPNEITLAQEATPEPTDESEATAEATDTPITELSYNSPVNGHINNATPSQDWPLLTASTDRLRIEVERLDGNLIPDLVLLDATQTVVGQSYGATDTADRAIIDGVTLPIAGQYTVRVGRDGAEAGQTTGRYRLIVTPLATAQDNVNNTIIVGDVEYDTPVTGEITGAHWYHRYTLTTEAADTVSIQATRVSGNLQPEVEVLDANGSSLRIGYLDASGDNARIDEIDLPSAGAYTVVVRRTGGFNGVTEGEYELNVGLVGSGPTSPNLEGVEGNVEYDTTRSGEITPARWYVDWRLTTDATDTLTITVRRANDESGQNLRPIVILLGGSGQEITRGYLEQTGDMAQIRDVTLQTPGNYTVRVARDGEQTGATSGAYTLDVRLEGSGEGGAALAGSSGTLSLGETVKGEISNRRWADSWTYSGTAGENLHLTAERTNGNLIPIIEIRDANGQRLTASFYADTRDITELDYTIPGNGTYTVVVMRYNGQSGATTGGYDLTVDTVAQ